MGCPQSGVTIRVVIPSADTGGGPNASTLGARLAELAWRCKRAHSTGKDNNDALHEVGAGDRPDDRGC
jgi:hypothetical protein